MAVGEISGGLRVMASAPVTRRVAEAGTDGRMLTVADSVMSAEPVSTQMLIEVSLGVAVGSPAERRPLQLHVRKRIASLKQLRDQNRSHSDGSDRTVVLLVKKQDAKLALLRAIRDLSDLKGLRKILSVRRGYGGLVGRLTELRDLSAEVGRARKFTRPEHRRMVDDFVAAVEGMYGGGGAAPAAVGAFIATVRECQAAMKVYVAAEEARFMAEDEGGAAGAMLTTLSVGRDGGYACWLPGCDRTAAALDGKSRLLRCSRCKLAMYCGPDHQRRHWQQHKTECRRLARSVDDAVLRKFSGGIA